MKSSTLDPNEFCLVGTRRIQKLTSSAGANLVAGAGWDGHVYVWNVETRERLHDFPTTAASGGVSLTLNATGSACFVGTYYAWGVACIDLSERRQLWRRTDLKRFYGLEALPHEAALVGLFDRKAGLTLDAQSGKTLHRHFGLRGFCASRFDNNMLMYSKQFELGGLTVVRHKWARESFGLLACAFSSEQCVVSEAGAAVHAIDVSSGLLIWTYQPRPGAHITALDFSPRLERFVALEYAYTETTRAADPMIRLLHFDSGGRVAFQRSVRKWPVAVFCANGELMLNGLGELHDVQTGEVAHVFADFPR